MRRGVMVLDQDLFVFREEISLEQGGCVYIGICFTILSKERLMNNKFLQCGVTGIFS